MADDKLTKQDTYRLQELADRMKQSPMLGFCGAGMSAPLGYPTWGELINLFLDRLEKTTQEAIPDVRLTLQAKRSDLPHVAKWIKERMAIADFYDVLKELFRNQGPDDLSREYECLVRLPIRHWMTTNFDNCLSVALSRHLNKRVEQLKEIPFSDLLTGTETMSSVTHLHGKISEPTSIILTAEDYQRCYGEGTALQHSLRSLAAFSILFVGYGLGEEELKNCLKATNRCLNLTAGIHYAIVDKPMGQNDFDLEMKRREFQDLGVRAIFYPVDDSFHSGRLSILENLLEMLKQEKPPKRTIFNLFWKDEVSLNEIRQKLSNLCNKLSKGSTFVSYCSLKEHKIELSFESDREMASLQNLIECEQSSFWYVDPISSQHDTNILSVSIKTSQICLKDGTVLTGDGHANKKNGESGNSEKSILNYPEELDSRGSAKTHDAMLHADATETLHPSHAQYRDCLPELLPKPLPFGLVDVFHPIIDWRFDSPIINVWVYTQSDNDAGSEIQSITAIGLGPDFIRQELESHAFGISISMPFNSNIVITRGIIHLEPPQINLPSRQSTGMLSWIGRLVGGRSESQVQTTISDDTIYALTEFIRICDRLSQQTGFVRVHHVDYADLQEYQTTLLSQMLLKNKKESIPVVIKPRLKGKVVKCISHPYYPDHSGQNDRPKIVLQLSGDLLRAPSLKRLLKEYYEDILTKMRADLERRIEFFQREIEGDKNKVDWYRNLSPSKKKELSEIKTDRELDYELALAFEVKGAVLSAEDYYGRHLPNHIIPREEKELIRLERLKKPLMDLAQTQYSAVWKRCLARLFDCALRRAPLCDDNRLNELAREWYSHVSGMLNMEWIKKLGELGISTQDVFRLTTYFNVDFNESEDIIEVFPNVVVDSSRTTVIIDRDRRTIVAMDPLDEAILIPIEKTSGQSEDETNPMDVWAEFLSSQNMDGEGIDKMISKMAFDRPDMIDWLCDQMLDISDLSNIPPDIIQLQAPKSKINKLAQMSSAALRGMRFLNYGCFHSAREILDEPDVIGVIAPYRSLFRAYMRCLLERYDPIDTLRQLREGQSLWVPMDIRTEFENACQAPQIVDRFLEKGEFGLDRIHKSSLEETAISVAYCIEAARLSMQMRSTADSFDCQNETLGSIFSKAADAIESVHNALLVPAPDLLFQVQKRITGQPLNE